MSGIRAIGNKIIVEPIAPHKETESGIVLTNTEDDRENITGKVIAVGEGDEAKKLGVVPGQIVMFNKFIGDEIVTAEGVYKVLRPENIFALVLDVGKEHEEII